MRRALASLAAALLLVACPQPPEPPDRPVLDSGPVRLEVDLDPFGLTLARADGTVVLRTAVPALAVDTVDRVDPDRFYDPTFDLPVTPHAAGRVTAWARREAGGLTLSVEADGGRRLEVTLEAEGEGAFALSAVPVPAEKVVHVRLSLAADANERFYGLGEWFDAFEHHGRVRDLRFDLDGTTEAGYNMRHVKAPTYTSTAGYGVLFDNETPLVADLASAGPVHLTLPDDHLAVHLAAGAPLDVVARLQRLAGLPPRWPAWAFGPQQWRNEVPVVCSLACEAGCEATTTGADLVRADADAMRALDLPASVVWIDAPWETGFNTFLFNPLQFPDPKGLLGDLHAAGYKVVVWASPFVNAGDDSEAMCGMDGAGAGGVYAEAEAKGYLVRTAAGDPLVLPWRSTSGSLVDFTNPEAAAWWKGLLRRAIDLGVDGFKLDFDDYVVPSIGEISLADSFAFHDGSPAAIQHARYHGLYHRAAAEALAEAGKGPGFLIGRTGNAHDAAWTTAVWPGDLCSGFQRHHAADPAGGKDHAGGLPAAMTAAVSLAASGHPYFGSDIGGYRHGAPDAEALARWIELGALHPVMQLGGGGEHHNPWDAARYPTELVDLYRRYARLHTALFPYLYTYVVRASEDGTPLLRAPGLAFPDDPVQRDVLDAFLFGDDLLVAPVLERGATAREVAFPEGRWVDWWTGEVLDGPGVRTVEAPLDVLPLYARAGALVPMLPADVDTLAPASAPEVVSLADRDDARVLRAFPPAPGGTTAFEVHDGTRWSLEGGAEEVVLRVAGAPRARRYDVRLAWALVGDAPPTAARLAAGGPLPVFTDPAAFDAAEAGLFYDAARREARVRFTTSGDALTVR